MKEILLSKNQYFEVDKISNGSYHPLSGYMTEKEFYSVIDSYTLPNGNIFSIPIFLDVSKEDANNLKINSKVKFYCESGNAHAQTLQASPHSAASSAVVVLPTASGNLIGTGDTGTLPLAAINIDGGTDIGADLTTSDLIVVDDGAGGTNRKSALSRVITLVNANIADPTALAIALG